MLALQDFQTQVGIWLQSLSEEMVVDLKTVDECAFLRVLSGQDVKLFIHYQSVSSNHSFESEIYVAEAVVNQIVANRKLGYPTIVIWEDLWLRKPDIIKSRILSILGLLQRIPGRLTKVRRLDKAEAYDFLEQNHLQGAVTSKTQYGLFLPQSYFRVLPDEIISKHSGDLLLGVATFGGGRVFVDAEQDYRSFEMIRFCNLLNCVVVGGLHKLLSAFCKDFSPDHIMTYTDLEWSDGASYEKLGFSFKEHKPSIKFWLNAIDLNRYRLGDSSFDHKNATLVQNMGSTKFVKSFMNSEV